MSDCTCTLRELDLNCPVHVCQACKGIGCEECDSPR